LFPIRADASRWINANRVGLRQRGRRVAHPAKAAGGWAARDAPRDVKITGGNLISTSRLVQPRRCSHRLGGADVGRFSRTYGGVVFLAGLLLSEPEDVRSGT